MHAGIFPHIQILNTRLWICQLCGGQIDRISTQWLYFLCQNHVHFVSGKRLYLGNKHLLTASLNVRNIRNLSGLWCYRLSLTLASNIAFVWSDSKKTLRMNFPYNSDSINPQQANWCILVLQAKINSCGRSPCHIESRSYIQESAWESDLVNEYWQHSALHWYSNSRLYIWTQLSSMLVLSKWLLHFCIRCVSWSRIYCCFLTSSGLYAIRVG